MQNNELTAGKTAKSFPMHLYIVKDCHWNHNIPVKVGSEFALNILDALCRKAGFKLFPRKVKTATANAAAIRKGVAA